MEKFKKIKFVKNFMYNALASALPVFVLQFIIEPLMAKQLTDEKFGLLITVVALMTMLSGVFGTTMNNSLLLNYKNYVAERFDFNILFPILLGINVFLLIAVSLWIYGFCRISDLLQICLIGGLLTSYNYYSTEYRINLTYYGFLVASVLRCFGYVAGYMLFTINGNWYIVFLLGAFFPFVYCLISTKVARYPYKRSKEFRNTCISTIVILASSTTACLASYFDRLLVFPLLGGASSSIYNSASLVSKGLSLVTVPLAGVILSYVVNTNIIKRSKIIQMTPFFLIVGVPFYFLSIWTSKIFLPLMYPQYMDKASTYLTYTCITSTLLVFISLIEPILLANGGEKKDLLFNLVRVTFDISFCVVGIKKADLLGFCIAKSICSLLELVVLYTMILRKYKGGSE